MPKMKHVAVSPLCDNTKGPPGNSASGSGVKRCVVCGRHRRQTREAIRNGLMLLRVRYGLPYSELPDIEPSQLGRYHLFLLGQGKERTSVPFPRRRGKNGLLQRLRRHERWEFALSVASIKRNLPAGCPRHTPSARQLWESVAFSQPPPPCDGYLDFVKAEVSRIFTPGWDRNYASFVGSHLPNPSARKPKKSRADSLWQGQRGDFFSLTTSEQELDPVFEARYKEVPSAGKMRPLVIYDKKVDLLGPLHKLMYSHLRRQEWLLCGPPTEKRISSVCVNPVQTSVDLVGATDGLSHEVTDTILDAIFFQSVYVPRSVRALAKASLRPLVDCEGGAKRVRHGQMMGAYLSFPLLCIQSYCAARWAARFDRRATFLVNGDDTLVSASRGVRPEEYPSGFRLNELKSMVAEDRVELNSTVFLRRGGKWREVRHLRRGGAPSTYSGMRHMAVACASRPCWEAAFQRSRIGRRWGFLPSQLGHRSYPAFLRERGLRLSRVYTDLPSDPNEVDERLVRCSGREATPVEAEALRSFLWENGRKGGLKRDVYEPTPGHIRRTYAYRSSPPWRALSYSGWRASRRTDKRPVYWLPESWYTEEEMSGLAELDLWRQALGSLVSE